MKDTGMKKLQAVLNGSEGCPTIFCIKTKTGGKKHKHHHYAHGNVKSRRGGLTPDQDCPLKDGQGAIAPSQFYPLKCEWRESRLIHFM